MNEHLTEFFKQQAVIDLNQIVFMLLKGTTKQRTQRFFLRLLGILCDKQIIFVQLGKRVGAVAARIDEKQS